jgi:ankyrin repeat protein
MTNRSFTDIFDTARRGNVDDVRYLIEHHGADINAVDVDGWTMIDIAKGHGNTSVVEYLDGMRTSPYTAIEQAEIDKFCMLYGNDAHAVDKFGEPYLLHEAAAYWDVAVVKYIVSLGADVNTINEGFTPLMSAIADNADIGVFRYLMSNGAGFRPYGDTDDDLIAFAREMGNSAVVEYLTGSR